MTRVHPTAAGRGDPRPVAATAGLLLAVALAPGCGRVSPFRAIERSFQAELPRLIGPADRYEVVVSRSGGSLIAGRIPWIEIRGRNVRAVPGLNLDELKVRLEEVRFDRKDHSVREIGPSSFEAHIGAASAVQYLHSRNPSLRDVRVSFEHGAVQVHATPALLGMGIPLEIDGQPVMRGPTTIDFAASRLAVLRLALPEFAVRRLESRINPLVDLSRMPFPLHLSAVRIEAGQAVVLGTAALSPAQLKR